MSKGGALGIVIVLCIFVLFLSLRLVSCYFSYKDTTFQSVIVGLCYVVCFMVRYSLKNSWLCQFI